MSRLGSGERPAPPSGRLGGAALRLIRRIAAFEIVEPVEEYAGEQHPPVARFLGHCALGRSDLLFGPPPVKARIGFHSIPHEAVTFDSTK